MFGRLYFIFICFYFVECTVNKDVLRKIDIKSHIVRIEHEISIDGSDGWYEFHLHPDHVKHLAYIDATVRLLQFAHFCVYRQ